MPVGTAASDLVPMAEDSPPAARWREAGLVLLAKTTMPDYGMLSSGLSSFHPLTRNPWNLDCNPGGSSAGTRAGRELRGLQLGLRMDAGWGLDVDPETRAAVQAAALALQAAGASVEPLAPFCTRAMADGKIGRAHV